MHSTEGRLGAAVAFDALRPSLTTGTYAVGWLQAAAIVVVGSLLTGVLTDIAVIGALLGTIVSFYALVSAYYVIGQTWERLHPIPLEECPETPPADRPAV